MIIFFIFICIIFITIFNCACVFVCVFEDIIIDGDSFIVMFLEFYLSILGDDVSCYLYCYDCYDWYKWFDY